MPLIADGGVRYSGDIAKAIAAGADTVMMGGMFAGTEEAPGEVILFQGRSYKSYRGMGSIGAMQQGSADRYFQEASSTATRTPTSWCPKASRASVPYKGSVVAIIFQMAGGLRASMGYCGCASIDDMHEQGRVRRDHLGRHPREPRARRADHQGSAELPRRMTTLRTDPHAAGDAGGARRRCRSSC